MNNILSLDLQATLSLATPSQPKPQIQLNKKKIPLTSERCIIFPFDKSKLRYLRDTYKKTLIKDVCTPEKITQVIADIESACDNFSEHLFYRKIIRIVMHLGTLGSIVGLALIIVGLVVSHKNSFSASKSTHSSGLDLYTVIGMIVISFCVILTYLVIIKVGHSTKDINMMYIAKYDKVLSSYRKTFMEKKMRWRIGSDRLWLELWLDFNKGTSQPKVESEQVPQSNQQVEEKNGQASKKASVNYSESDNATDSKEDSEEEFDDKDFEQMAKLRHARRRQISVETRERSKGSSKFEIAARRSFMRMPVGIMIKQKGQKEE